MAGWMQKSRLVMGPLNNVRLRQKRHNRQEESVALTLVLACGGAGDEMNAEALAKALGGLKTGGSWMARCPAHDDSQPSLSVTDAADGKVLVCCHAGCAQRDVVAALRSRGLWEDAGQGATRNFEQDPGAFLAATGP